jgi:hypothetical protein
MAGNGVPRRCASQANRSIEGSRRGSPPTLDDREPRWPVFGPAIDVVARRRRIADRRIAAATPGLVEPPSGSDCN